MSHPPRVTVIMPSYNYARFLPDAIASLQAQTCTDWECIVVDDGSTDDTAEVVADLMSSDRRIRYLRPDHGGLSAARNAGLKAAEADSIQFLDADDRLEPDKLRAHIDYLGLHRDVDIVHGDAATFRIGDPARVDPRWLSPSVGQGADLVDSLAMRNSFTVNAAVVRRHVFDQVGSFATDLRALEDWDFWMRCAVSGVTFARHAPPDTRALVGIHPTSMSRERGRMLEATVVLRRRFAGLALPPRARMDNERHLARVSLRLALVHLGRGRLRLAIRAVLAAVPMLVRAYR